MPLRRAAAVAAGGGPVVLDWPQEQVARITLSRPAVLNAIDIPMIDALGAALRSAAADGARALVVTGSGASFCVGADLKMLIDTGSRMAAGGVVFRDGFLDPLARVLDCFEEMPFPTIAAIHGHALGGGCELALSCDFRVIARTAVLGLPEVRLGATPGAGGVQKLIRHVGRAKALEWILLGSNVTAAEAARWGLATQVVAEGRLMRSALALAERLCTLGPAAIAQAKRSVYVAEDADLRTARRFGVEALALLSTTDEWREGLRSFREKRPPSFARSTATVHKRR